MSRSFVFILVSLVSGCAAPVDDPAADTEDGTTDAGTSSGAVDPSTTTAPASTSTSTSDPSTTTAIESTGMPDASSSSEDSAGFIDMPDGGTPLTGFCLGFTAIGWLGTVAVAGEAEAPACSSEPAACGGDPVGTWTIADACGLEALPNFFEQDCPGSTMEFIDADVSGTRTFADDGAFEVATTLTLDVAIDMDTVTCFGVECAEFGPLLEASAENIAVACSDEDGTCTCLMTITNEESYAGTWAVADDAIVLTVDGQDLDPMPYCVVDGSLATWDVLHESQPYPETPCADAADCEEALGDAAEEWVCLE